MADDDPGVRIVVVTALEDAGYDVLEARCGAEAIALIDDPDHVELVVTDLNMPGHDGVAVAAKARAANPDMLVLYITGRPDLLALRQPTGAYRRLDKPFTPARLAAIVSEMLPAQSGTTLR